jgi:cobalt-zinc-cadmium resistance protein CzcA
VLDNIIRFSIKNKLIIGLLTFGLVAWGSWSASQLPIDAVPDITDNQVQVITNTPSLAAPEVERLITFPIELTMANIPQIEEIRSFSRFGLSVVTIVFKEGVDVYWARQQVGERLILATQQIPTGIGIPYLAPVTTGLGEIYQYIIRPTKGYENKYNAMELRSIQDWIVRRQLLGTEGLADVSSFGGLLKQYEIAVNPDKLRSMNISLSDIFLALEKNNQNTGGAYIDKKPNALFIRSEGLVTTLADIEKIVVKQTNNNLPLVIRDIAKVQFGNAIRYGAMTRNTEGEVVGGIVLMLKGANSSEVISNVKERIEQIQKSLPEGVVIEPFLDRTKLVNNAIQTVSKNLAEGALIVIFVLVLMLGNFRAGLIVASVIPLALLFAIVMMNLFGVSGNLMSLGALDFGLIVDGAVIIVEATLHHFTSKFNFYPSPLKGRGEVLKLSQLEMDEEVYQSASKIRNSAAFGEIIILIVYIPILALVGVEGKMFKPMAQVVSFAILGAFILSLTYIPMITALVLKKEIKHSVTISDRIMTFFHRLYHPSILFVLNWKKSVVIATITLFGFALYLFLAMGGEFIPTLDEGDFAVETRVLTGSSISQTIEATTKASDILLKNFPDEIKEVVGKIGSSEIPTDPMPMEACDLMVILNDKDNWKKASTREELADKMAEKLEALPGVTFGFQQPIQMRFNELMTGERQDVVLRLYGEDLDILSENAAKIGKVVASVEGAQDLYLERVNGLPQIQVILNRDRIAQFGLSVEEVNNTLQTAFAGKSAGLVFEGERRYDLVIRLDKDNRQGLDNVENLFITAANGQQIPLNQLAEVSFKVGPNQIQRDDAKRRIVIGFNVRNRDVESIVNEIKAKVEQKVKLPAGYYVTYGGAFKNLQEGKERLAITVPVALLLIFVLLFFTFNSVKQAFLIFTAVPLSAIGGVFALWLRGMPFSISAGVGFIALFGVAVLNGIVLISEFNRLRKEGLQDLQLIVLEGTAIRLRPVIMTALVASLGFLPMALSYGSGAEVQKPLATVVIGGLLSATLLTLLVLPILYIYSEKWFDKKTVSIGSIVAILMGASMLFPTKIQAQAKIITLEEALKIAETNNSGIKSANYQVDYQYNYRKTASDLGKTNATLMLGQYNSNRIDNNFTLTQYLPFPTILIRQGKLANKTIESSKLNLEVSKNELGLLVKNAFYKLSYFKARQQLLLKQDSLLADFVKASAVRFRLGETNELEKATAESQYYELKNLIAQNEADERISINQLQTLLNTSDEIDIATQNLPKRTFPIVLQNYSPIVFDSTVISQNPGLAYFKKQVEVTNEAKRVENSKLLPDINIGYFNQSLIGTLKESGGVYQSNDRFQGILVGLSFPLWAKPQLARAKSAEINRKIAQANAELFEKSLEGQYKEAWQQYQKFVKSLEYYEKAALPTAEVISKNALKAFKGGNIGYIEFSQGITRALSIQTNYLAIVNEYNLSVINIEFLIGSK